MFISLRYLTAFLVWEWNKMHFNSAFSAISGAGAREVFSWNSIGTPSIAGCWNSRCCWCAVEQQMSLWSMIFSQKKAPEIRNYDTSVVGFLFSRSKVVLASLDGSLQSCQTHFVWSLFRRLQYLSTTVLKDLASLDDDFGSFTWTTWHRPTQESFRFEKPKKKPVSLENTSVIQDHFWTSRYTI